MSEQVRSVTRGGIRFQSSFTIRWELEDKNFLKIDIINFVLFSNSVTFRKPRGTDLVTASELIPGIPGLCRSKSNVPTPGSLRTINSPTWGIVSGIKSPPLARPLPPPPRTGFTLIGALPSSSISFPCKWSTTTLMNLFSSVINDNSVEKI